MAEQLQIPSLTSILTNNETADTAVADKEAALLRGASSQDRFKDYLEKTAIWLLQKEQQSLVYDAASDIRSKSVYKETGDSTLV